MTITKINLINQPEEAMQKQKRQFENGFEVVTTVDTLSDIKATITEGPEQDRVVSIIKSIVGNSDTVQWYSHETHSGEDGPDEFKALGSFPDKMETVYDSASIDHGPSGYNIIDIAYDKNHCYFILSLNGSSFNSALSDYYRVERGQV